MLEEQSLEEHVEAKTRELKIANELLQSEVAERRLAEKALSASEARFREVLENSLDAAYKRNLQSGSYDYLSPAFARISGYTPDELMAFSITDVTEFIHPDDLTEVKRVITESMSSRNDNPYYLQYRFKHKDGRYRWFHDRFTVLWSGAQVGAGLPLARIGSVSDITDRKRAEDAMQDHRWRLASIIEGTRVGTWEWNVQTGQTCFNERWAEILGYRLDELLPTTIKTWERFAHPKDFQKSSELLERHFAGEIPFYECECRMKHRDGHWVWVLDRGRVITRTDNDKPLMMFGTHSDISKRKQAEKALQKAHGELELRVLERTSELEKSNATLAMMLDYARKTEMEIQERVVSNIRSNIMGIVDVLKKQELTESAQDLVELLEESTRNMAHPFARNIESQLLKLTAREMQLANFIRLGKSTKELAVLFNLSVKTVESHRNNLRKKLGLCHKKVNLRTFLNSEFEK
jgi:PAS domain S-box-containing protein